MAKIYAIEDEDGEIITEADISNSGPNVPWLKDEESKWELEDACLDQPGWKVIAVKADIRKRLVH